MRRDVDVVVIGAGLHGAAAAMHLARRGLRVVVLDKEEGGRHSSRVNAGGLRRLLRHPAEIPLAMRAMELWRDSANRVGDDCGLRSPGHLKVAESVEELGHIEARLALMHSLGYEHEVFVDRMQLGELVPGLAGHCLGALMCRDDGYASPARSTRAFQRRAALLGATVLRGRRVVAIERNAAAWRVVCGEETFTAPALVNCAGAWGDVIAAMIGDVVPLVAEAPMMMVTAPMPRFLRPVIGALGRKLSLKQLPTGAVLIGGGYRGNANRDNGETQVDVTALAHSARTAIALLPNLHDAPLVRCWAGIEGMTPDRLPIIGFSPRAEGVFHAFGFSSHGFLLAPAVGQSISEVLIDGRSELSLDAFNVGRFATHPG